MKVRNRNQISSLALHVALGGKTSDWSAKHKVPERTVRSWTKLPEFQAEVHRVRQAVIDQAVGVLVQGLSPAIATIRELMKTADNEHVRLGAARAILADMVRLTTYSDLSARIAELEGSLKTLRASP